MTSTEGVTLSIHMVGSQLVVQQVGQVTHATQQLAQTTTHAASNAGSAYATMGRALTAAGQVAATAFAATAAAIGGVTVAALKTGVAFNVVEQTSRAALSTLLGGVQAAKDQMDKLDAFVRQSPFAKDVFVTAQQQLIGFGVAAKDVIPILTGVQDAVAAVGGSNQQISEVVLVMSQIQAAGKITGVDLMQLAQRGINAADLIGQAMGKTGPEIRDAITKGTIPADVAIAALTKGMEMRFAGAAASVKDSATGAWDHVKAGFRDLGGALAAPFIDPNGGGKAVVWGEKLGDVLFALKDKVAPIFGAVGSSISGGADKISALLDRVKAAVDKLNPASIRQFMDQFSRIAPAVAGVSAALFAMGGKDIPILGKLLGSVNPLVAGLLAMSAASPELRTALGDLFDALKPLLPVIADVAKVLAFGLTEAVKGASAAIEFMVRNKDWFGPLAASVAVFAGGLFTFIKVLNQGKAAWKAINEVVTASKKVWATHPVFLMIAAVVAVGVAVYLLRDKFKAAWDHITAALSAAWKWMKGVGQQIGGFFAGVWEGIRAGFGAAWNWIEQRITWVWQHTIKPVVDAVTWTIDHLKDLNPLAPTKVAGHAVAAGQAPDAGLGGLFGVGKSRGGINPGYAPGVDSIPVMSSPGEAWLVPEVTRAIGHTTINNWNAAAVAQRGPQRMAFGGIAGVTPTYSPGLLGKAMQEASWKSVFTVGQAVSAAGQVAGVLGAAAQVINGVKAAAISGNDPVQKWRPIAVQALQMTGQYTPGNLAAMMQRLSWESSGNPMAVNNWDRNAKAGTPSEGLWQVIKPTFDRFAQPGFNKNIFDPLSNALASINYAKATYGSLEKAYGKRHADGSVAGYDKGGVLPPGGIAVSNLATPEAVLASDQWQSMHTIARSVRSGQGTGGNTYNVTFDIKGNDPGAIMAEIESRWAEFTARHDRRARVRSL